MNKNQKGSIAIILTLVSALFLIIAAGYFVYKNNSDNSKTEKQTSSNTNESEPSKTTKSPTSGNDDENIKNDVAIVAASIAEYMANNNGVVPASIDTLRGQNVPYEIPDGWTFAGKLTSGKPSPSTIYFGPSYKCNPSSKLMIPGAKRQVALAALLSNDVIYCIDI